MKAKTPTGRVVTVGLGAIVVLLLVDLIERPNPLVHLTLELGAALVASVTFVWLWVTYVRRSLVR